MPLFQEDHAGSRAYITQYAHMPGSLGEDPDFKEIYDSA